MLVIVAVALYALIAGVIIGSHYGEGLSVGRWAVVVLLAIIWPLSVPVRLVAR